MQKSRKYLFSSGFVGVKGLGIRKCFPREDLNTGKVLTGGENYLHIDQEMAWMNVGVILD